MEEGLRGFLALFDTTEGENSFLQVRKVEWEGESVRLWVECDPESGGNRQDWEILCEDVEDLHLVSWSVLGSALHLTEHPYLWPFTRTTLELYIHGVPKNPDALLRRMLQAYEAAVGINPWNFEEWPPVPTGIRNLENFDEFFSKGYGMLAKGPDLLVQAYAKILEEAGLDHQTLDRGIGWRLEGREHLPPPSLLFLESDHVIARNFKAVRRS